MGVNTPENKTTFTRKQGKNMSVLIIGGSTSTTSKSEIILDYIETALRELNVSVARVNPSAFNPTDLVNYNFASEDIQRYQQKVASADAIIIATPVYQAAYSGALKLLLDLIPQKGLEGKTVLPLATGGSLGHLLALDYALKPVLSALAASRLLASVFVTDDAFERADSGAYRLADGLAQRLDRALNELFNPVQALARAEETVTQPVAAPGADYPAFAGA
jgi:FMN reductase